MVVRVWLSAGLITSSGILGYTRRTRSRGIGGATTTISRGSRSRRRSLPSLTGPVIIQRMMTGPVKDGNDRLRDLLPREIVVVAPPIPRLLVLRVYPKIPLDVINPALSHTRTTINQPDPAPKI